MLVKERFALVLAN